VSAPGREWRQFRLLAHDSVRRLLSSVVLTRDGDPLQFAIWVTALATTPPSLYAFSQIFKYALLRRATPEVMERVVLGDRMFFVLYAMIAAALLAALTWEALVPDRTDQEIVGVLPVRPRTLAAARLTAAMTMATAFAVAINLPASVFFALVAATHPLLGSVPMVFIAHLTMTVAAALTVFLALLAVRGVVALSVSTLLASVTAGVLQLASIGAVIEALVYVPSLVPFLVRTMIAGGDEAVRIPPVWFAAAYSLMVGTSRATFAPEARVGLATFALALALTFVIHLLPSAWLARRTLASMSKGRARSASTVTRLATAVVARVPAVRAMAAFTIATVTRNRRHAFVPLGYLGAGIAIAATSLVAATIRRTVVLHEPRAYLLSLPLVLMFFAVLGLRASFRLPVEFDANWPFRVCGTRVGHAAASARATMMALIVLPLAGAAVLVSTLLGWGGEVAARLGLFELLAGLLLVEAMTFGWHGVPFGRAFAPSVASVKWRGPAMLVPLNLFAFRGADAQIAALHSVGTALIYAAVVFGVVAIVGLASRQASKQRGLVFDESTEDGCQTLGLSEAL